MPEKGRAGRARLRRCLMQTAMPFLIPLIVLFAAPAAATGADSSWAAGLTAGRPPAQRWSFAGNEGEAWKLNPDLIAGERTGSGWKLQTKGGDPFLTVKLAAPVPGPAAVRVLCVPEDDFLYLELFTAGTDGDFGRRGELRQMAAGGAKAKAVWFIVEQGPVSVLRLDPEGGRHGFTLQEIAIWPLELTRRTEHPVLPKPSWRNTFYMVPIHETFDDARYDDAARRRDMQRLKEEISPGRLYMRMGFSASSPQSWNKTGPLPLMPLLESEGLVWHAHHHVSNHSIGRHPELLAAVKKDRRHAAWRADGSVRGEASGWNEPKAFNEEGHARTTVLACMSRQADEVITGRRDAVRWLSDTRGHTKAASEYPEVMVSAGCSVENELPMSPQAWGCYSPYTVQEFQDWLRHRGLYAKGARFAAQAAPESVTGPWVTVDGSRRSPFYDDPSPAEAHGTGQSFNAVFGTAFTSWKLEYYDAADFPPGALPWTDDLSNALPAEGERGNLSGHGFDAPRRPPVEGKFWRAWDNEDRTAPGFRQFSVWAWNQDTVEDFAAAGFPRERLFTHQIPAEYLYRQRVLPQPDYRPGMNVPLLRRFSTASPVWTADDLLGPWGGAGCGITAFDYMTCETVLESARALDANWALLEYHPESQRCTYHRCIDSLRACWRQRVHVLAPGWWGYKQPPFMLDGTDFARALKDWMHNPSGFDESDQPWDAEGFTDYTPPAVHDLKAVQKDGTATLTWSDRMWPGVRYATWSLWREWRGGVFVIERDGKPVAEVPGTAFTWTGDSSGKEAAVYTVHARRTAGVRLEGARATVKIPAAP